MAWIGEGSTSGTDWKEVQKQLDLRADSTEEDRAPHAAGNILGPVVLEFARILDSETQEQEGQTAEER